ncbi:MAG TPA: HAD family hydrolase [Methanoculleus sp.]|nr:HAD family hydrolase [Methanoculleus sp.]
MAALDEIEAVFFDCYNTLIDIRTDERSIETYRMVSAWLAYHGVSIDPVTLKYEYRRVCRDHFEGAGERFAEIRIEEVFSDICSRHRIWRIDETTLGRGAARTFRAASIRRKQAFPESLRLLEHLRGMPMGIVSNGQRVFSEQELRYLGLYDYFDTVVFSSDHGYQKPDPRLFAHALDAMRVAPEAVLFVGDSFENDILAPRTLGMRSMFIHDAWTIPDEGCREPSRPPAWEGAERAKDAGGTVP